MPGDHSGDEPIHCFDTSGEDCDTDLKSELNSEDNKLKLLCDVERGISAILTGGASEYQIGSRRKKNLDLAQLLSLRDALRAEIYGGIAVNTICVN